MTHYIALTAYDVPLVKAPILDRKTALAWAESHGSDWPGGRIVQMTARGPRTVWKSELPMHSGDEG